MNLIWQIQFSYCTGCFSSVNYICVLYYINIFVHTEQVVFLWQKLEIMLKENNDYINMFVVWFLLVHILTSDSLHSCSPFSQDESKITSEHFNRQNFQSTTLNQHVYSSSGFKWLYCLKWLSSSMCIPFFMSMQVFLYYTTVDLLCKVWFLQYWLTINVECSQSTKNMDSWLQVAMHRWTWCLAWTLFPDSEDSLVYG